jgi:hypothetical protein
MTLKHWLVVAALGISACTPSLNWREVRLENSSLKTLLPCKPDHGSRNVTVGKQEMPVQMSGCEAQGHLLAVARLPVPAGAKPEEVTQAMKLWQEAALANFKGQITGTQVLTIKSKDAPAPGPLQRISATGTGPDGKPIQSQMVLLVHEGQIIQAVVFAPKISAEVSDTFFAGLELP